MVERDHETIHLTGSTSILVHKSVLMITDLCFLPLLSFLCACALCGLCNYLQNFPEYKNQWENETSKDANYENEIEDLKK